MKSCERKTFLLGAVTNNRNPHSISNGFNGNYNGYLRVSTGDVLPSVVIHAKITKS